MINQQCWEGSSPMRDNRLWPKQEKPNTKAWSVWRKYISRCYLADESSTRKNHDNLRLATPLGAWLQDRPDHRQWDYYINPISLTIYQPNINTIKVLSPCRNTRTKLEYIPTGHTTYCPSSAIPIKCVQHNKQLKSLVVHKRDIPTNPSRHYHTNHTFKHYLSKLEPWEQELLHNIHFQCTIEEFQTVSTTPIIVTSNGSVANEQGSFGWVIATTNGTILATGSGIAFGYKITSFRSEAYGILAPLRLLYHHQCFHHSTHNQRPITWYCDSESLLKRIHSNLQDTINPNRYKLADNDLEIAIITTIPMVCTNMNRHHIRSHQNDHIPLHRLPLPQRLNRMADSLAADIHNVNNIQTHKVPLIRPAGCQLHTRHGTITRSYTRSLHEAFTYQQTLEHIC